MLTSIAGRSVIVTGASKGIGKGIARVFAGKGAKVLLAARDLAQVEAAAAEIRTSIGSGGGIASAVAADVSSPEDCARMAATATERHGGIDIVCSNAGVFPAARLGEMSVADWDQVLDINLKGTFLTVNACLPD